MVLGKKLFYLFSDISVGLTQHTFSVNKLYPTAVTVHITCTFQNLGKKKIIPWFFLSVSDLEREKGREKEKEKPLHSHSIINLSNQNHTSTGTQASHQHVSSWTRGVPWTPLASCSCWFSSDTAMWDCSSLSFLRSKEKCEELLLPTPGTPVAPSLQSQLSELARSYTKASVFLLLDYFSRESLL